MSLLIKSIIADDSVVGDDVRDILLGDESMNQISSNVFYGLGIFKEQVNGITLYHHAGEDPGYHTENLYFADDDISVTMFFNCTSYEPCTSKTAEVIQTVVNSIVQ